MSYQQRSPAPRATGWVGWIIFAAALLAVVGTLSIIAGLTGIFRDKAFFAGGQVVVLDYTAWGWIHLLLGIALILVGYGLYVGSTFARVAAVVVVFLHLIGQFLWIGAYPWWSLISITLCILVLYSLIVHGGELADP
jgi:hypothetical protein